MELPTRHASVASDAPKGLKAQEMVGTLEQGEEKKQHFEDFNGWKYVCNVIINHTNAFTAFTPYT